MPRFGFAIDLRRCIGCHACTIACKAEHQIPVGVNRCWVKTVEKGVFPDTRRFFFPVLCNQCTHAPCVRICPTGALYRRPDGIVDLNGLACIGCRACMVACPYDQLFIDPNTRTAEKCNFCANRVENELLPACVSVCPTECRIFGDLDDPTSEVARVARSESISVRRPEKGTLPNVFYVAADESTIQPEAAARPFIYKEGKVLLRPLGATSPDPLDPGAPRVDYDTPHQRAWGFDMAVYLLTKGVSTGTMLLCALLWWAGLHSFVTEVIGPAIATAFSALTAAVLVIDLERPERFYYILVRPNPRSWMAWGAYFLTAHGAICAMWTVLGWFGQDLILGALVWPAVIVALLATCYTGLLFAQGLARDLWQGPHATIDLLAQAVAEGAATLLLAEVLSPVKGPDRLVWILSAAIAVHLAFIVSENLVAPSPTRHHELATASIRRGAFAPIFWAGAIAASALALVAGVAAIGASGPVRLIAPALALVGSFAWEYVWVEAGQAVPIS